MNKSIFFQEANYCDPEKYEDHFDNEIARRENEEIERILRRHIPADVPVTDVGCGSGLGRRLLPYHEYTGIDLMEKSICFCRKHYHGQFHCIDAGKYIEKVDRLNPIFLFSIDYIPLDVVEKYLQKIDQVMVAVHLNKPYLSQTSVYSGKKDVFEVLHPEWKRKGLLELFQKYGGETFPLLGEEYYWVTVIKRGTGTD